MDSHSDVSTHPAFDEFVQTIAALRAPDGCPWDKEQTHKSITQNMIEEAFEAVDAIEADDVDHMREELGDVLLQVVLQSQIAKDEGEFTIDDVIKDVNDKIVRRHPHVFGDAKAGSADEVLDIWDREKLKERTRSSEDAEGEAGKRQGLLDGIPRALPSLIQAQKISRKAAACGFEWESVDNVWAKVAEEEAELKIAYDVLLATEEGQLAHEKAKGDVLLEMGDVLFSLVNVARKMGINAEEALRATCRKFRERWAYMEEMAYAHESRTVESLNQDELERLWEASKHAGL